MRRVVVLMSVLMLWAAPALAQGSVMPLPVVQFEDSNGVPLSGGLLYTCQQGGSCPGSTQTTYADAALATPNANPVVLDTAGRAHVFLSATTYKFVLQTSAGVTVWTQDNVTATLGAGVSTLVGVVVTFKAPTVLTLSSNAVTATQNVHALDTSGGAANLNTINIGGSLTQASLLYLYGNNTASNPVTVKNGAGNITLIGGDYSLDGAGKWLSLMLKGTTWFEIGRASYLGATQTPAITANVLTLNYQSGPIVSFSFNANINTTTLTNLPPSGQFASFTFVLTADGTLRTWAWLTATVKWPSGTAPTFTSTLNKKDVFTAFTTDGGTNWYGVIVGQNF